MTSIVEVRGRQIFDSRGNPTVEVEVALETGVIERAAVPSGASTGTYEAVELRDGDAQVFQGKGVLNAVKWVNTEICDALTGMDSEDQLAIDNTLIMLDGTPNKARLGANAILGTSLAVARASAKDLAQPLYRYVGGLYGCQLPSPMMNVLNGGCHADNILDIQEFMIIANSAGSYSESFYMGVHVFHALKQVLKEAGYNVNTGDEGGFAPQVKSTNEALDLLCKGIELAGFKVGDDIAIALDVAATELYKDGKYHFKGEGKVFTGPELIKYYESLVKDYPIISIEDGMAEEDWQGWHQLTEAMGATLQLVGDDIFVTNMTRLERGISEGIANAILIKPNQVGTLSETAFVIQEAKEAGYSTIMSHRSGETDDTTIADLAVGFNCGQIKTGAPSRMDRVAKYNQLLRIEEQVNLADLDNL